MKTTELLLSATKDIGAAYSEYPSVLGIQDYLYLEEYAKVFAVGIAEAKSPETFQLFSKYVTLIEEELNIHRSCMGQAAEVQKAPDGTPDVHPRLSFVTSRAFLQPAPGMSWLSGSSYEI